MAQTYTGQVVLIFNGAPYVSVKSVQTAVTTNRELVVGMTPDGAPAGKTDGTREISLDLEVYIPKAGEPAWADITDAIVALLPRDGGAVVPLYTGCFVKSVNSTWNEKGPATRRISMGAVRVQGG